mmetsp:Transcript_32630/g.48346  ORF Transcript_32630/g.48346 Transcript_32630/m.48346 type:complete len:219 (+) Transcript_32630:279-935(+)
MAGFIVVVRVGDRTDRSCIGRLPCSICFPSKAPSVQTPRSHVCHTGCTGSEYIFTISSFASLVSGMASGDAFELQNEVVVESASIVVLGALHKRNRNLWTRSCPRLWLRGLLSQGFALWGYVSARACGTYCRRRRSSGELEELFCIGLPSVNSCEPPSRMLPQVASVLGDGQRSDSKYFLLGRSLGGVLRQTHALAVTLYNVQSGNSFQLVRKGSLNW